jgi:hypothetical protein
MAAPVKPGTSERYWREVEGLSRLEIALLRDPDLTDEERGPVVAAVISLKTMLVGVAGVAATPADGVDTSEAGALDVPAARVAQ